MTGSSGTCSFCNQTVSKRAVAGHLESCLERKKETTQSSEQKTYHLLVEARNSSKYWLYLEVRENAKLKALDEFLRDIWLECCGHLSAFEIEGQKYCSSPDPDFEDKSMNVSIGSLVHPGLRFSHEYDFGSTTELSLLVLSEQKNDIGGNAVKLLARNNPPSMKCEFCGKQATEICGICSDMGKGLVCNDCRKKHNSKGCDGEDSLMELPNSPRAGVCGYEG